MSKAHLFSPIPIYHGLGPVATGFVDGILAKEKNLRQETLLSWRPGEPPTALQQQLVAWWAYMGQAHAEVDPEEMDAVASWNVIEVNRTLKEWGCNIQLDPQPAPDKWVFYLAALAQFTRHWMSLGTPGYWLPEARRKAFALTETHGVKFGNYGDFPVVIIPVQEGGWVFLTKATEPLSRFDLYGKCLTIWEGREQGDGFPGVVLPYWEIEHLEVDVADLCGLTTNDASDQDWWISQALMECDCSFGLDGTFFKAAFAAAMMRGGSRAKDPGNYHVVDYDVYYGIVSPKGHVIASAYVPTDVFSHARVALDRKHLYG